MSKRKGSHRARRALKDWTKGNRERISRLERDGNSDEHFNALETGRQRMKLRAVTIDEIGDIESLPRGQVVQAQSGAYNVLLDERDDTLSCRVKRGTSTENNDATLVTIGDYVRLQPLEDGYGLIHHIEERGTYIGRSGTGRQKGGHHVIAANLDQIFCVATAERDGFRRTVIDRYIVGALLGDVTPVILLNKIDTADDDYFQALSDDISIYAELEYQVLFTSATVGTGVAELREACQEKTSALVGQSGVGKSTLVNTVLQREERETGVVRESDRRGRHTTVDSEILSVPGGGRLIDTPGLREFGIYDLEPQELDGYFVEFLDYLQDCKYLPCSHTHEPDCAVLQAVEAGEIDEGRYASYLRIIDTLEK
ncbi:MAG: ribosome small subunit-dependent GTPase A [Chlorobi bacterium]|nr:ribosome small subunit-dependent GTPase A [Chlorobiota bacterium]